MKMSRESSQIFGKENYTGKVLFSKEKKIEFSGVGIREAGGDVKK